MKSKNNKAGFSLIELMVVVAIIGILATIAVPNFSRFQAKAKQSNAKVELAGIYTAQKSFFTEYSTYHTDLGVMGYQPEGSNPNGSVITIVATNTASQRYYGTTSGATGAAAPIGLATIGLTPSLYVGGYFATPRLCGNADTAPELTSALAGVTPTALATTFIAVAKGCPRQSNQAAAAAGTVPGLDAWNINQDKILQNQQAGI